MLVIENINFTADLIIFDELAQLEGVLMNYNFYYFKNIFILYSIFTIYIYPVGSFPHSLVGVILFTMGILLDFLNGITTKINKNDLFLLMVFIIIIFFEGLFLNHDIFNKLLMFSYLVFLTIYKNTDKEINYNKKLLIGIIFFSISLQLLIFGEINGRYILGVGDPNFAAFSVFVLIIYLDKNNFTKTSFLTQICALFLFKSRSFLLSIIIFYLIKIFKNKFKKIVKFFKLNKFIYIYILIFILLFLFTNLYLDFSKKVIINSDNRFLQFFDASNRVRFNDYSRAYDFIFKNNSDSYLGLNSDAENIFINKTPNEGELPKLLPHNDFLKFMVVYGIIYTFFYYLFLSYLIKPYFNENNYEYIYSLIVYSVFLHTVFYGFNLIIFMIFLMDENR
jgi:hypothetical protein